MQFKENITQDLSLSVSFPCHTDIGEIMEGADPLYELESEQGPTLTDAAGGWLIVSHRYIPRLIDVLAAAYSAAEVLRPQWRDGRRPQWSAPGAGDDSQPELDKQDHLLEEKREYQRGLMHGLLIGAALAAVLIAAYALAA